ncbi:MAG: hypothetical protein HXX11_17755 [Desulfuromonadales bacterium]|nr:hypothetical protein [Desulfuromonadales bacterium]
MEHDIWSIVLLIGLWGWIISTLVFIFRAFPSRGEFAARPARIWGMCSAVSFAVWIVGLLKS